MQNVLREYTKTEGAGIIVVSARIGSEIAELSEEESAAFLEDLGLEESGLTKLIKSKLCTLRVLSTTSQLAKWSSCMDNRKRHKSTSSGW